MGSAEQSRYRIGRPLGAGGAAEVFEALLIGDQAFERRVALKRPLVTDDPAALDAFIDEARIASALHHANIAGVIDFGVTDDRPFIITELVEGIDLATAIERSADDGGVPLVVALHVVNEVAHALEYAHDARDPSGQPMRIVHRDVSPENVLLSWQGDVKLTDFGIAHATRRLEATRAGVAKGKLGYIAPEQLIGGDVDGRADLFALGCVLHALVLGASPLADPEQRGAILRLEAPSLDPELPPDVSALLSTALHGDRRRRFPNARAMGVAVGAALIARLEADGRSTLRSWLAPLNRPATPAADARRDLFGVELVFTGAHAPVRRFDTRAVSSGLTPTDETRVTELVTRRTEPSGGASPAAAAADPLIGQVIHGFRLDACIGGGATSRLYRAQHLTLDRRYAVKVLHPDVAAQPRWLERFRREAQQLSRIQHPHVVAVTDFGTTAAGQPFLAMEYLEGRPLGAAIGADGTLPPARVRGLVLDLCAGLGAIEREGLVHRDIKPNNVMLVMRDGVERAVIVDFGLVRTPDAAALTPLTQQGALLGTPAYMSPEQITRPDLAGPAADRYALGAVVFAMLAGRPPFGRQTTEAIEGHLHRPVPPLPPSEGVEDVVYALMAKDPAARPALAQVVAMLERGPTVTRTVPAVRGSRTVADVSMRVLQVRWARAAAVAAGLSALVLVGAIGTRWLMARTGAKEPPAVATTAVGTEARASAEPQATAEPPRDAAEPPRTTAELRATPEPSPKRAPRVEARATATPRPTVPASSPRATAAPAPHEALRDQLAAALRTRGLRSTADLEALGPAPSTRALEAALRARDDAAAGRVWPACEAEISRARLDPATILRLIERIELQIKELTPDRRGVLEQRQIDLWDRATRRDVKNDPARAAAIVLALIDFERDVARAARAR